MLHATFAWHANLLLLHVRSAFRSSVISSTSHSDLFNFALWPARCPLPVAMFCSRRTCGRGTTYIYMCVSVFVCVCWGVRLWPKGRSKRPESKKLKHSAKPHINAGKHRQRQKEREREAEREKTIKSSAVVKLCEVEVETT